MVKGITQTESGWWLVVGTRPDTKVVLMIRQSGHPTIVVLLTREEARWLSQALLNGDPEADELP